MPVVDKVGIDETLVIKNDSILTYKLLDIGKSVNYGTYEIFWDEGKSGINIFNYLEGSKLGYIKLATKIRNEDGYTDIKLKELSLGSPSNRRKELIKELL